jgi:hypothetical protein
MRAPSDRFTASSRTISSPPQESGPIRRGIASITAIVRSRWSQSVGALVTPAELKSGPAASRNVWGTIQSDGRGFGSGTPSARARPIPAPASHKSAIPSRVALLLAGIGGFKCVAMRPWTTPVLSL